jgi:GxxExxY protein
MNMPQSHRGTEPEDLNELTEGIIGCAIAVHRALGPGLREHLYESALCIEFDEIGLRYERQKPIPVRL